MLCWQPQARGAAGPEVPTWPLGLGRGRRSPGPEAEVDFGSSVQLKGGTVQSGARRAPSAAAGPLKDNDPEFGNKATNDAWSLGTSPAPSLPAASEGGALFTLLLTAGQACGRRNRSA